MHSIVFLHGFSGSGEAWQEIQTLISSGPSAQAPDVVGHGQGPEPLPSRLQGAEALDPRPFEHEVDRLAALLKPLCPVHLVGYSMGGRLALGLLARHPELVARATLIGARNGLRHRPEKEGRAAADERWAQCLEKDGLDFFLERWTKQPLFASQSSVDSERLEAFRRRQRRQDAARLAAAMRQLSLARMPDYGPLLSDIHIPIEVIVGALDRAFLGHARELCESLPTATWIEVPNAGHNVVLESPGKIADLLSGRSGS